MPQQHLQLTCCIFLFKENPTTISKLPRQINPVLVRRCLWILSSSQIFLMAGNVSAFLWPKFDRYLDKIQELKKKNKVVGGFKMANDNLKTTNTHVIWSSCRVFSLHQLGSDTVYKEVTFISSVSFLYYVSVGVSHAVLVVIPHL